MLPAELADLMLPDCAAIAEYTKTFSGMAFGKYTTYWFPRDAFPRTALEEAIRRLYPVVGVNDAKNAGGEWW
jgi:hypothetical protein